MDDDLGATRRLEGFTCLLTIHDWRHHWAFWRVMSGIDLPTIQCMGGWASLRVVERYAAVSTEHMDEAMRRLA